MRCPTTCNHSLILQHFCSPRAAVIRFSSAALAYTPPHATGEGHRESPRFVLILQLVACKGGRRDSEERMRIVGLTGGIASGKSTVSNLFKASSIPVVDADIIARDVLKKGTGGWKKVVAVFGEDILQPNGEVDRPKFGQIVFSDPDKRQLLNRILAPYISSGIFWEIFKLWINGSRVVVLDIPLLFEAKMDRWTNPVIVVWVDPETQFQRLMARDRSSEEEVKNRISSQMALDWKRSRADMVIDNTGSLEDLNQQFKKVLSQVSRPLTWTEFFLSRGGAFSVFLTVTLGVILLKKILQQ